MLSVLTRSPALRQQALRVRAFHASTPARSSGHDHYHVRLSQAIFMIFSLVNNAWNTVASPIPISRKEKVRICG